MPDPSIPPTMRRYDAYIDSGTEWLGEVPAHWQITRIKGVFRAFGSGSTPISSEPAYYDGGTIPWLNTADLNNDVVNATRRRVTQKAVAETSLRIYPKGTLAIAMYGQGETRGNVGLMAIESTANQASLMMHRSFNSVPRFMLWWFVARKYSIRQINIGATQPNMNQDFVRNLVICLPPLPEQQAIADYLDAKTTQIDRRIDLLTQKSEKYRQLKQSLINEAVTRGLDKSAPMKDSGDAWIGDVPAHWTVGRVKDFVHVNPASQIPSNMTVDNLVEFVPMSNVDEGLGKIRSFEMLPLSEVVSGYKRFQNGDVIFARITPCMENGNCAVVQGLSRNIGFGSTEFQVCRPLRGLDVAFLHYFLHNEFFRKNAEPFMKGSAGQKRVPSEYIETHGFPLPPMLEQRAIVNYLAAMTTQIDRIVQAIDEQTEKLALLRKALINDGVTGKLRVT